MPSFFKKNGKVFDKAWQGLIIRQSFDSSGLLD